MPIISIIIPIYKVEKYIDRCLQSIMNQTFADFEALLIDDGSPDNSYLICEEYVNKDNRFKYYKKENGGLSDARNYGITICQGNYLCFIDSDDFVHREYLQVLYDGITKSNSQISIVNYQEVQEGNSSVQTIVSDNLVSLSGLEALKIMNHSVVSTAFVTAWGKLYKKELFESIRFPVGKLHEDEFTTYKLFCMSQKVTFINSKLYFYVIRPGSIISSKNNKRLIDLNTALVERVEYCLRNNYEVYSSWHRCYESILELIYHRVENQYKEEKKRIINRFLLISRSCPKELIGIKIAELKYFKLIIKMRLFLKKVWRRIFSK